MRDFLDFVRKQGVVGLAVGFILGGAVSKLVTALVTDVINPFITMLFGGQLTGLNEWAVSAGSSKFMFGALISVFIDFVIIALVVYFGVKWLKLDRLDKKD